MTINILFFTITISKRKITLEEALNNQRVEKLYEENKDRAAKYIRNL
ncbi:MULTISPECIES: YrzI family small protein [Bacillaceae]|jgi:uncharacterized protein (TIGR02413 family)|uniref:YrzI family small protein n=1 Tax=Caldibacillus thermoamylovorans TaxID=35841 RepID=A0A0D0EJV4_9BACI|nr:MULTISPECIES: YrzI family small protein [Bacillaceae]MCB5935046.1 YrzI family small protein [Bacillus sp. DFI.2.34]KIO65243.1 hypothetical protein B4166_2725 [Caldibacillus thermoamylovorans]KIO67056.1 hypothetical protein B4065_2087 [Caldibacillus thermoamylovorans]KIO69162.1 hypothetical protein B4064_1376 [Caldibacillus thermoamylovorans]KIO71985.1 hypothetical protein B4167_3167 [Caldibacillus thermoamylovorans]